ncbi:MAG TPA: efflux RND transporter periplasmic adaptor subunit [Bryobacterales bacterium]|nr:efflux RND transporter periplasmic adaptor subunit [Bryobacterales bacterium]
MKRLIFTIGGLLLGVALWVYFRQPDPPEIPAARVRRGAIVQLLTTNGKVEAVSSVAVFVRAPTLVRSVSVQEGDTVRRGESLAEVDTTAAREALARARAQLDAAKADQALVERGGTAVEMADLDAAISRASLDREAAEREVAALQRLVERRAAARSELLDQQQRLFRAQSQLTALERKRHAFLGPEDRDRIRARIQEAEIAVTQASGALRQTELLSPEDGVVYSLSLKAGGFYNPGAQAAQVGKLDTVRVRVLVDEPDLGRLEIGQPVRVTWDALPSSSWQGTVERLPSEIRMAGTRSVGEVLCTIDNPGRRLLPNVTVNVEIRTGESPNALTIPRDAVVQEGRQSFVLLVDEKGVVARRPVRLGLHDAGRVEVLEGLADNQVVLLPGDHALSPGQVVRPRIAA